MTPERAADRLWEPQFTLSQAEKEPLLLARLNELTSYHTEHCLLYRRYLAGLGITAPATRIEDVPSLPTGIFKIRDLRSIPEREVFRVLTSSGTSGQPVSRISIDRAAAALQTKALAATLAPVLGRRRLPMLIIDTPTTIHRAEAVNARAAGILGMMTFGRDHVFALDDDLAVNRLVVEKFLRSVGQQPFLMFGFTFLIWACLRADLQGSGLDFSQAVLLHGGGWKALHQQSVDNTAFKAGLRNDLGLTRVHNFYGMVEQIGTIFLEGEDGVLHAPNFADVVIRDPENWHPLPAEQVGVIQVLSSLPHSYPGHSILTEDLGYWLPEDPNAPWRGKRLVVQGRAPMTALRGCSDVQAAQR